MTIQDAINVLETFPDKTAELFVYDEQRKHNFRKLQDIYPEEAGESPLFKDKDVVVLY